MAKLPRRYRRTAMSFFIVRDFFSFALFAEVSGWPSVSSIPQRLEGEPGHMPVTTPACQTPERLGVTSHAAGGDEPGWFHW